MPARSNRITPSSGNRNTALTTKTRSKRQPTVELDLSINNDSAMKRVPRSMIKRAIELTLLTHRVYDASVSIVLVSDRAIRRINKQFLQHDYATDVITFPLDDSSVDGEIYISSDTAVRQAKHYGVSTNNEVLRLVVHGVLHLVGFDDATDVMREHMHRLENEILEKL